QGQNPAGYRSGALHTGTAQLGADDSLSCQRLACGEKRFPHMTDTHGPTQRISKIARVMDEIAFQTSILRLNAAVEASGPARPSPAWSAQAASDTTALLEQSIASTHAVEARVLRTLRERARLLEGARSQAASVPAMSRMRALEQLSVDDQR